MDELLKDFLPANAADWKARLEKDLKGITFDQLSLTDRNGITIRPFYSKEDIAVPPEPIVTQPGWSICAQVTVNDAATANKQALYELNNGASGICFILEEDIDAGILLREIELPYIYTCFKLNKHLPAFIQSIKAYASQKGWSWQETESFIAFDYIAGYIQKGHWQVSREQDQQSFEAFLEATQGMNNLCIDAALFQNAGATATYELASALAQANEYLNLPEAKLQRAKKIHITLATGTAFFEQIAQLRAFRNVLGLLLEQYNIQPEIHLHIETGNIYRSPFDSYSNLLRDTIAAMAGVLGDCNSLYIRSFNETLKEADDFSRRMSRNQQLIFKEESYLDKVADVAAGSYYIEALTEQIAVKAWQQFKDIEQEGGLIAAFEKGTIQKTIEQQAAQLVQEYKDGKRVLIGVNKFPNPKDEPKPSAAKQPHEPGLRPILLSEELF